MECKIAQKKEGCKIAQLAKYRGKIAIKPKYKVQFVNTYLSGTGSLFWINRTKYLK